MNNMRRTLLRKSRRAYLNQIETQSVAHRNFRSPEGRLILATNALYRRKGW